MLSVYYVLSTLSALLQLILTSANEVGSFFYTHVTTDEESEVYRGHINQGSGREKKCSMKNHFGLLYIIMGRAKRDQQELEPWKSIHSQNHSLAVKEWGPTPCPQISCQLLLAVKPSREQMEKKLCYTATWLAHGRSVRMT